MKNNLLQFLKYGFVGAFGTLIHTSTIILLVEKLNFEPIFSSFIGFIFSLVISYFINRQWTFSTSGKGGKILVKYTLVSLTGLVLNLSIMYVIVYAFHFSYLLGQFFALIIVPIFNFILNKYWTFAYVNEREKCPEKL
ncbi:putative flippase GtrA [Paenibacillus sp. 1182]|uniref:GtrA family protein n=1 Tax=Paenibacillus sp. 1182 TaxID=2806565 RepID=UPI000FBA41C8|nr:GtrA family protein [Paenibacillus sp. 1182]MBP1308130.1 putative flippase GtrA [Paenibacillus sp. 1182]